MTYLTLNMKKKFLQLNLLICVLILNCVLQSIIYANNSNSRLWKIEKNGVEASYLLATMHSEDPRILSLPEKYKKIFIKTKSFTAEIDMSIDNTTSIIATMMLPDNKKLKKIIGNDLFNKSVIILNDFGIPEKMVNQMKPWAVLMTLSYPKPKTGLFLDKLLFDDAIKMKKRCYGLETMQEQIAIFDNISYVHQTILLRDSIIQFPEFKTQLEIIKQLYLNGNLEGLRDYNHKIMLKGNYRVANKLMLKLIDQRNRVMVKRMQPRLNEGSAFIAVGALHLPGDNGILHLLRNQDYQLTPVH